MPNPPIQQIPPEPPQQVTQNFARLLEIGRAAAQRLSSDVWTDYNEHDPGVTILDALCYAMTDLGYRTAHPIEDILASSMAQTKTPLDKQPLFTGDRILTNAPLTQNDFRLSIFNFQFSIFILHQSSSICINSSFCTRMPCACRALTRLQCVCCED